MSQLSAVPAAPRRSKYRLTALVSLVLVGLASFLAPASAVTNGTATGSEKFSGVGVVYDSSMRPVCTASLYATTAAATSSQCGVTDGQHVMVNFDPSIKPNHDTLHHGMVHVSGDLAAVVFHGEPVTGRKLLHFPHPGQLDHMSYDGRLQAAMFTLVGYGAIDRSRGNYVFSGERNYGTTSSALQALTENQLILTQNSNRVSNPAGACAGDLGSPAVLGDSVHGHILFGLVKGFDAACVNTTRLTRVDNHQALGFFDQYGPVWVHGSGFYSGGTSMPHAGH